MNSPIRTDANGLLLCPTCNGENIHSEMVYVAARREDGNFNEITINAITGQIATHGETPAPVGVEQGQGRRQRIAVTGYCEQGGHHFAIVFTQHKGVTYFESVPQIAHEVVGDPELRGQY